MYGLPGTKPGRHRRVLCDLNAAHRRPGGISEVERSLTRLLAIAALVRLLVLARGKRRRRSAYVYPYHP